jgi:hypothetical protein
MGRYPAAPHVGPRTSFFRCTASGRTQRPEYSSYFNIKADRSALVTNKALE